jgi:hypothetical protein
LHQAKVPSELLNWLRSYKEMLRKRGDLFDGEKPTMNRVTQLAFEEFIKNHTDELRVYYEQQVELFGSYDFTKRGENNE